MLYARSVRRSAAVLHALLAVSALPICGCKPKGTIARDAPTTIEVGKEVTHQLTVLPKQPKKSFFSGCYDSSTPGVSLGMTDTGLVRMKALRIAAPFKFCAKLMGSGNLYDTYEWDVTITGTPDPWRDDPESAARAVAKKWKEQLERGLVNALDKKQHPGKSCSSAEKGVSQVYDETLMSVLEKGPAEGSLPWRHYLGAKFEAARAAANGGGSEKDATLVKEITSYLYAVYVLAKKVRQPEDLGSTGGTHSFRPGAFDGSAALVNLATGEVVCRAPLSFKSSKAFTYHGTVTPGSKEASVPALEADFAGQSYVGLRKAFEKVAPKLRIVYGLDLKGAMVLPEGFGALTE